MRVNILAQIGGIHTRISSHMLLVERLDEFECLVGRVTERLVALHLQRGQVKQSRSKLRTFLFLNRGDGERLSFDGINHSLRLFERGKAFEVVAILIFGIICCIRFAEDVAKKGISVQRFQFVVCARHKALYLLLALDDQRQGRCLHASDGQDLTILPHSTRVF